VVRGSSWGAAVSRKDEPDGVGVALRQRVERCEASFQAGWAPRSTTSRKV